MNDFSARDIQKREMKVRLGPGQGQGLGDRAGAVAGDPRRESGDPYELEMTARINGEVWSRGNSRSLYWKFEQMIEFLTRDDTVYPGDVIGSGTVGTGCGLELDRWVKPRRRDGTGDRENRGAAQPRGAALRRMLMYPLKKGRIASQAHVGLPEGTYEEEHGRKGFYGKSAHLYHAHPPTGWIRFEGKLRPHCFDLNKLAALAICRDPCGMPVGFLGN